MKTEGAERGIPVLLVCPEDAARVLGVGRTKVYELMRSGALRSVRVGGLRRVSPSPRWLSSWRGWRGMRHDQARAGER